MSVAVSTLPAAAPMPPFVALPELPLPPVGGFGIELCGAPISTTVRRRSSERAAAELRLLRAQLAALEHEAAVPGIESPLQFRRALLREWARAKQYWLPLSLLVVKPSAALKDARTARALAQQVGACCRDVDMAFELPDGGFAVVMLATNRTGAEAERREMRRALNEALLRSGVPFTDDGSAAVGLGLAMAFDDAGSVDELVALARERALLAVTPPCWQEADEDGAAVTLPLPLKQAAADIDELDSQDHWTLPAASTTERQTVPPHL